MKIKTKLSKLNHKLKYYKKSKELSKDFLKDSILKDAVNWHEIKNLLSTLQPMETGHDLIRIGSDFDGGYLVPDDLQDLDASFSPGVSVEIGFDLEMSKICKQCFLADASVEEPIDLKSNMNFIKKFIGNDTDADFIKFEDWINEKAPKSSNLLLQMDIEGAEYDILSIIPKSILDRFRIILIEFHDFNKIFNREYFEKFKNTFKNLGKSHTICHIHCNNTLPYLTFRDTVIAPVFELTYLRNDRIKSQLKIAKIPHHLDQPNSSKLPNLHTPNFWK